MRAEIAAAVAIGALLSAPSVPVFARATPGQRVSERGAMLQAFQKRVDDFVALHRKLEARLPPLSKNATPKEIDRHERALAPLIQQARAGAARGDIFGSDMAEFVRGLMRQIVDGDGGDHIRASIQDENVKELPVKVNERYPDEIPLTTMPPQLLKELPELPEELEYRFIARNFVILDPHAHLVVDFVPDALPKA
jgi:hypothetical protein